MINVVYCKPLLIAIAVAITSLLQAQTDSVPSGVVHWKNIKVRKTGTGESRQIANGSTLELANLSIHASTLNPGLKNHPPRINNDFEELIIVKEGNLKVNINDSSKVLGPGGIALIVAGDRQSFENISGKPSIYYVLKFKSRKPVDLRRSAEAGGSFVKDWKDFTVRQTDKGESRPIFVRPSSMFQRFDVHATALNPQFVSHLPHTHRAEEIILVIKGNVQMQIGQHFYDTREGDLIFLASGSLHAAKNIGSEQCGYFAIQWNN